MQSKSVAQGLKTIYEAELTVLDDELDGRRRQRRKKQDGSSVDTEVSGRIYHLPENIEQLSE